MRAAFIFEDYVYTYSIIDSNTDADFVNKMILQAQETHIFEILGENLYNKLVNDCPDFTGYYKTLMDNYIQPALCHWTVYEALPFGNFKFTNKAISQKSSDNSVPSTFDDVSRLQSQVRNIAESYSKKIKNYIMNNPNEFPEYFRIGNSFEKRPNKNVYYGGIYTGRSTGIKKYKSLIPPLDNIDPCDFC